MNRKALVLCTLLLLAGCRRSAAHEVALGNRAFADADFELALESYEKAQQLVPSEAEPVYNLANTRYRQGVYTETQQLLPEVLAIGSGELRQHGYFNLGNTQYQLQDWAAAVEAYKEALRLNPNDFEAKYNLELALRHLQDQVQQDEQSDRDQNQQSEQPRSNGEQNPSEEPTNQPQTGDQQQNSDNEAESNADSEENGAQESQGGNPKDSQPTAEPSEAGGEEANDSEAAQSGEAAKVQPIQGLSQEQARQLLSAIGKNTETLQEHMQQIFISPEGAPEKDW